MLNLADLALQLLSVIVALAQSLVKLEVFFFYVRDRLFRRYKVLSQLLLYLGACGINKCSVLQLLIIVRTSFLLFSVHLHNDAVYLLGELVLQ